jgi:ELWxxDGT repeat protein
MVALGSRLFFFSQTCCVGTATLYVTDATAAGTNEIAYVNGAPREGQTLAHKGKLYFVAETGGEGDEFKSQELWSSNGTMIGTHRVPGTPLAEEIDILPASGANLYFATSNYWPTRVWESRLWKTDGTKSGTKPLTTVGELHGLGSLDAAYMASRLYFSGAYSYGGELWKTDGTAAGTFRLVDLEADPRELTLARSRLFFTVGQDLWRTNGTAAGTSAVRGFEPGMPAEMIAVGDYLYLTVVNWDDGTWTLWKSDGTVSGTNPVRTYSGAPDPLAKAGLNGRLLFAANDGAHGTELWTFKP